MKRKLLSAALRCPIAATARAAWAAADPAEEKAWKKEPAYGREIIVGYNGGLCLETFGIAQMKGFYEAEGLKTKIVRMEGGGNAQTDAIGTGKADVAGGHIATMLVPAVNGVRMKFKTGIHTGCKSLYVLNDSPIKSTKDLEGKYMAILDGTGQLRPQHSDALPQQEQRRPAQSQMEGSGSRSLRPRDAERRNIGGAPRRPVRQAVPRQQHAAHNPLADLRP